MWAIYRKSKDCTKRGFATMSHARVVLRRCYVGQTFAHEGNPSFAAGDKHLTRLANTCANILRNSEDYMARQNGRGSSRPWASTRLAPRINQLSGFMGHSTLRVPLSLLTVLVLILTAGIGAWAQTSDVEDIHVSPRVEQEKTPSI